ncbi:MAG TPA: hypothetical protein VJZ27_05645, partial [Aggregatilineales bacterium]|nr:hypothetical protein [Aggregatilineales bacterium]
MRANTDDTNNPSPDGLHLVRTLRGHQNTILRAVWMPLGRRIGSASLDNTVRIWDVQSEQEMHRLIGDRNGFSDIQFTRDGRFAFTTSWESPIIEVWDVVQGGVLMRLDRHAGAVNAIRLTQDERHLISASDDDTLKIWSIETGTDLMTLRG